MNANIGWLFYRDYYEEPIILKLTEEKQTTRDKEQQKRDQAEHFKRKNDLLCAASVQNTLRGHLELPGHNKLFALKTTYPGLLLGTGYTHETGLLGEIKIGFFFDHTTGLPVLPGSSVKGILRSAFPGNLTDKATPEQKRLQDQKATFIRAQLDQATVPDAATIDLHALEAEIFDGIQNGKAVPLSQRDIFGDAYPSEGEADGKLLGIDFITPHGKNLLKNPIPIQMLRILPGVTFTFQFRLTKGLIEADAKRKLFKQILLHLGAGAKTNVGYGRFEDTEFVAANKPPTYYKPSADLPLLPNRPPKPRDNPPQRTVNFSDIVPPVKQNFFAEMDAAKYDDVNGHYYYNGNVVPGVLLEAIARKIPANPKQKYFKLLIGAPGQEYEVPLSYSDDSIVGKPCVVKVSQIDKKKKTVQTIEFKLVL